MTNPDKSTGLEASGSPSEVTNSELTALDQLKLEAAGGDEFARLALGIIENMYSTFLEPTDDI